MEESERYYRLAAAQQFHHAVSGLGDLALLRAERLGFYNHLAYMRIYGSDNDVEGALRFLDDETALPDFGRALAWAKSVGNEVLVDKAYCRNGMIAANSGYYHMSNRYHLKCFEAMGGPCCGSTKQPETPLRPRCSSTAAWAALRCGRRRELFTIWG